MRAEDAEITIACKDNMIDPGTRKSRAVFSTPYGAVRVYTRRHINGCALISTDDNSCPCPKWIYSKPRDGAPSQRAAQTSSFAEAREKARKILEDPLPPEADIARELSASQAPGKFLLSSLHGTVRVYTRRHINGCSLAGPHNNRCPCPKWIYSKPRGGKALQEAAKTGSFTEACRLAEKILKAMTERPIEASAVAEVPPPEPAKRTRGRKIQKATLERIPLAARLEIEGLKPYAMTDKLYPPGPGFAALSKQGKANDHRKRFERELRFLRKYRKHIEMDKERQQSFDQNLAS
jgi:hypothetical protein